MFGFIVGTACLIGLVSVLARRRRYWHRRGMNRLFDRLDATEEQKTAIRDAFEEIRDDARRQWEYLDQSWRDIASALRQSPFEPSSVDAVTRAALEELGGLGSRAGQAFARAAETLDERQRERLAGWLDSRRRCHRHPYRTAS